MKVLMFGWEFPPHITGGLGTACFGLSQSLCKLVTKLTFVLPKVKGPADAGAVEVLGANDIRLEKDATWTEAFPDTTVLQIEEIDSPLRPYDGEASYRHNVAREAHLKGKSATHRQRVGETPGVMEISGDYGKNLFEEVRRYALLASRAVLKEPYDLIHAHDWMTFGAAVEAKRLSGLPLVVHVHATEFDRTGENIDRRIYDLERMGMEQADRIIAVSQRTKDMIVARYGIPADKVTVVHNGVAARRVRDTGDTTAAREPAAKKEKTVVFVGRITLQKGPEYYLEAAYLVLRKLPNVRFVMGGSGDMMPQMIERMAQLGIVDRFHFTGFLNEKRRDELYSMADLFVLTSISEPFGITPIEAMQHDVPVIVTRQSGVAEVVYGAVKVDFWDVRRMADAMINILTQEPLSTELKLGGRRDVSVLTWDRAAEKVRDVYREMR